MNWSLLGFQFVSSGLFSLMNVKVYWWLVEYFTDGFLAGCFGTRVWVWGGGGCGWVGERLIMLVKYKTAMLKVNADNTHNNGEWTSENVEILKFQFWRKVRGTFGGHVGLPCFVERSLRTITSSYGCPWLLRNLAMISFHVNWRVQGSR